MGEEFRVLKHEEDDGEEFLVLNHEDEEHQWLSLYSFKPKPPQFQLTRPHLLPIYTKYPVFGNRCDSLYLFFNSNNEYVVCDLGNSEFKTLTLPSLEPPPHHTMFHASAIGRDPDTRVYKVVFVYNHHFSVEYYDFQIRALMYSFDTGSFKTIECPVNFLGIKHTVYVGHKVYWTALIRGKRKPAQFGPPFIEFQIVSFNFRTKQFSSFSFPPYPSQDYRFNIVGYGAGNRAKLGAVGYSESGQQYDIWVYQEHSWTRSRCFHFGSPVETVVESVLAIKDERFVFLEIPELSREEDHDYKSRSKIYVHYAVRDMPIGFIDNVQGRRGNLAVFSYVIGQYRLSDGKSMISSYTEIKDEEVNKMEVGEKKNKNEGTFV